MWNLVSGISQLLLAVSLFLWHRRSKRMLISDRPHIFSSLKKEDLLFAISLLLFGGGIYSIWLWSWIGAIVTCLLIVLIVLSLDFVDSPQLKANKIMALYSKVLIDSHELVERERLRILALKYFESKSWSSVKAQETVDAIFSQNSTIDIKSLASQLIFFENPVYYSSSSQSFDILRVKVDTKNRAIEMAYKTFSKVWGTNL